MKNKKILLALIAMCLLIPLSNANAMKNPQHENINYGNRINNMSNNVAEKQTKIIKEITEKCMELSESISDIKLENIDSLVASDARREDIYDCKVILNEQISRMKAEHCNFPNLSIKTQILMDWLNIKERIIRMKNYIIYREKILKDTTFAGLNEFMIFSKEAEIAKDGLEDNIKSVEQSLNFSNENNKILTPQQENLLEKDILTLGQMYDTYTTEENRKFLNNIKAKILKEQSNLDANTLTEILTMYDDQALILQKYSKDYFLEEIKLKRLNYSTDQKINHYKKK